MPNTSISVKDKVAIITGASRGIGRAVALAFAADSAKTVLVSRKREGLEAVAKEITEAGGPEPLVVPAHAGKTEEIDELLRTTLERHGRIDILVNNAATNPFFGPMVDITMEAYDKTFQVNLRGAFYLARECVKQMIKQGGGRIVNVSSIAGFSPPPLQGVYAMTKAGLIAMTKGLAREAGPSNVYVNAVAPGLVDTRFSSAITSSPEMTSYATERSAVPRVAQPDEIVGAIHYLASDAASFTTGEVIVIDGGATI